MTKIFLLITATFIWGLGFVGTRWTLTDFSPIWSNSLRFLFAGSISLILLYKNYNILKERGVIFSSILLGAGLQLQTIGIAHTTLAKSGFLTVFYAIFTPILTAILLKTKLRLAYWGLVLMAFVGIAMLCELEVTNINLGDIYILCSALLFSLHILAVDRYGQNRNAFHFNFAQCVYIGVFCTLFALLYEGSVSLAPLYSTNALKIDSSLSGFFVLSIFSSLIAFSLQVYAQQGIPPHIVSLIFLAESIFASIFGYIFFNEILTPLAMSGCFLVLLSVALVPVLTNYKKDAKKS
ncbi:DMT family transporter [Halobacteriovorax sp. HLS]|uniref:DMT family transporter n=1 Tax=Halobacteriovorax sp. HLS TaxID=2234000 RepID=UPI000FD99FEA|nr:DMT family transporter [Halobacteriovorax sp. HLS]